jgi:choline dehydrogenase-like flavoprotein
VPEVTDFDAIVIGSGFGGAVAACRLVGAGKRICLLERGRRYESQPPDEVRELDEGERPWSDFPDLPREGDPLPDPKRWAWGDEQGLWELRDLGGMMVVQAAGYGGGSLVYANVHLRAPAEIFDDWPFAREELDPYYELAAYMLNAKPITQANFGPLEKTEQFEAAAAALKRDSGFFYPPLAVNFDGRNNFNRTQAACNGCGECLTGCRYRSKNTLDLNYLAVVDDSPLAEVLTQAEAVSISGNQRGGYDVEYLDHLSGGRQSVASAKWCFICAGAVNSTELLRRSQKKGKLPKLSKKDLGNAFYPNADFPAIVYDARTPTGEPRLLEQTRGPTITATLYHQPSAEGTRQWHLLQDGGLPASLARHFGVFRAPALLRRNRHDDRKMREDEIRPAPGKISPLEPVSSPTGDPPLLRSLADGLYALVKNESEVLQKLASKQLRYAVDELEQEFRRFQDGELLKVVDDVLESTLPPWLRALSSDRWRGRLRDSILENTKMVLRERYNWGGTASNRLDLVTTLASWLLKFDDSLGAHSRNSLILLGMGPDSVGGRIKLEDDDLRVEMKDGWDAHLSETESLMRDVACALGGKLRVNPLWSFARKPVTVHSQGGCPMSDDPKTGVTSPFGEVYGCPGLFVMDAAAFPTSVGVNPSATIAAVAERGMAKLVGEPEHKHAAAEWWAQQSWRGEEKIALEPCRNAAGKKTVNRPIGIAFDETMTGFHWPTPVPGTDSDPNSDAAYRAAEVEGRLRGSTLSIKLGATIPDLSAFVHAKRHTVDVKGIAKLVWDSAEIKEETTYTVSGTLTLPDGANGASDRMFYELHFDGVDIVLTGFKRLRNDSGTDTWRDTSRLLMTLNGPRGVCSHGIIHVALDEFIFDQLPSFRVLNTEDPARIAWALSSFGAYFFGHLQRIYLPQLGKAVDGFLQLDLR